MEQTVYIDLYFLINLAMDLLCFYLTARLLSLRISLPRCVLASAFGGVYACAALFFGFSSVGTLLADAAACVVMSAIAFLRKREARQLPFYALVYTAVSILLGGFMTALFGVFNRIGLYKMFGSEENSDGLSVWLFGLLALISGIGAMMGGKVFRRKSSRRTCYVRLGYGGKSLLLRGLCDSGNLLCDPISAKPCVITDMRTAEELLPRKLYRALKDGRIELADDADARRIRVIPIQTASGEGIIYALKADEVSILTEGKGGRERRADALIAFSFAEINADGARVIVPCELAI